MSTTFDKFDIAAFGDLSRADLSVAARHAESAERYENMCSFMRALVQKLGDSEDLSTEVSATWPCYHRSG